MSDTTHPRTLPKRPYLPIERRSVAAWADHPPYRKELSAWYWQEHRVSADSIEWQAFIGRMYDLQKADEETV